MAEYQFLIPFLSTVGNATCNLISGVAALITNHGKTRSRNAQFYEILLSPLSSYLILFSRF